jgi:ubiquinone/menaquinone biosynthesis C-methylase UbiE
MGLYGRHILPRLLDMSMRHEELMARRAEIIPRARGRVLEIGIGSGLNLHYYGDDVTSVYGIDPSPELLRLAQQRANRLALRVVLHEGVADVIPLDSRSVDTVVMTWTLCSLAAPEAALSEIRRVLRLSGQLLFVEHGLAPEPEVGKWQRRLEPMWRRIAGGCHLSRKIDHLIHEAGFDVLELATGYMQGPRLLAWGAFTYQGRACVA